MYVSIRAYATLMFMSATKFKMMFSDIGGVLATNGWDSGTRKAVCTKFGIDPDEIEPRHRLIFDTYERGYMSFEEYLRQVFFNVPRNFNIEEIRDFAHRQSVEWTENIDFLREVKRANQLKLALISNEGQGIAEYRAAKFKLRDLADFIVVSCFVHMRKPDRSIWQLALDLAQVTAKESIYIDDRAIFADRAAELGFTAIHHVSLDNTRKQLGTLGLQVS